MRFDDFVDDFSYQFRSSLVELYRKLCWVDWLKKRPHSQISMTMDIYSHVLPTTHQDAMDKLNQAFKDNGVNDASKNEDDDDNAGGVLVPV